MIWYNFEDISDLTVLYEKAKARVDQANYELIASLEARKRIEYEIALAHLSSKGIPSFSYIDVIIDFKDDTNRRCRFEGFDFNRIGELQVIIRPYTVKGKPMKEAQKYSWNLVYQIRKAG